MPMQLLQPQECCSWWKPTTKLGFGIYTALREGHNFDCWILGSQCFVEGEFFSSARSLRKRRSTPLGAACKPISLLRTNLAAQSQLTSCKPQRRTTIARSSRRATCFQSRSRLLKPQEADRPLRMLIKVFSAQLFLCFWIFDLLSAFLGLQPLRSRALLRSQVLELSFELYGAGFCKSSGCFV